MSNVFTSTFGTPRDAVTGGDGPGPGGPRISDADLVRNAIPRIENISFAVCNDTNQFDNHDVVSRLIADAISDAPSFQEKFPGKYVAFEDGFCRIRDIDSSTETPLQSSIPSLAEQRALQSALSETDLERLTIQTPTGVYIWLAKFLRGDVVHRFDHPDYVSPLVGDFEFDFDDATDDGADSEADNNADADGDVPPGGAGSTDNTDESGEGSAGDSTGAGSESGTGSGEGGDGEAGTDDSHFWRGKAKKGSNPFDEKTKPGPSPRRIGDVVKADAMKPEIMGENIVALLRLDEMLGASGLKFRNLTITRESRIKREGGGGYRERLGISEDILAALNTFDDSDGFVGPQIGVRLNSGREVIVKFPHPGAGKALDVRAAAAAILRIDQTDSVVGNVLIRASKEPMVTRLGFGDGLADRKALQGVVGTRWRRFETTEGEEGTPDAGLYSHWSIGEAPGWIFLNRTFVVRYPDFRAVNVQADMRRRTNGTRMLVMSENDEAATCVDRGFMDVLVRDAVENKNNPAAKELFRLFGELFDAPAQSTSAGFGATATALQLDRLVCEGLAVFPASGFKASPLETITQQNNFGALERTYLEREVSILATRSPMDRISEVYAKLVGTPINESLDAGCREMHDAFCAIGIDLSLLRPRDKSAIRIDD